MSVENRQHGEVGPLERRTFLKVSALTVGGFTIVGAPGLSRAAADACEKKPWDEAAGDLCAPATPTENSDKCMYESTKGSESEYGDECSKALVEAGDNDDCNPVWDKKVVVDEQGDECWAPYTSTGGDDDCWEYASGSYGDTADSKKASSDPLGSIISGAGSILSGAVSGLGSLASEILSWPWSKIKIISELISGSK